MMLFFLCILIIFLCIFLVIRYLSIRISIINLEIDTNNKKIINDYQFEFGIYIFNKLRIIKFKINEKRIKKLENSKILKKISKINLSKVTKRLENKVLNNYKSFRPTKFIKIFLKEIQPEILKFKLNLKIGLEDIMLTTYAIPFISTLISFFLKLTVKNVNLRNKREYYYKIEPVYNTNIINLRLNCIINVKMVHIINIIYIFLNKKGRSDKYERTSYRRSYGYGHE